MIKIPSEMEVAPPHKLRTQFTLLNLLQPGSQAARKWRANEKMKRKWKENEEIKLRF